MLYWYVTRIKRALSRPTARTTHQICYVDIGVVSSETEIPNFSYNCMIRSQARHRTVMRQNWRSKPHFQVLRRYRRSLLLRVEHLIDQPWEGELNRSGFAGGSNS